MREATARLLGAEVNILSLSPLTLAHVLDDGVRVGRAAGVEPAAHRLVADLRTRLDGLRAETAPLSRPRVLVLEWLSPPMVAGHWTPELIRAAGGEPILGHDGESTGPLDWAVIVEAAPEVVLMAPCGFRVEQSLPEVPALAALPGFVELPAVRAGRVVIADGNAFFNRPGPRLVESAEIAAMVIHPEHFSGRFSVGLDAVTAAYAPRRAKRISDGKPNCDRCSSRSTTKPASATVRASNTPRQPPMRRGAIR
jgi:iron complex transport system substrate-binding protein